MKLRDHMVVGLSSGFHTRTQSPRLADQGAEGSAYIEEGTWLRFCWPNCPVVPAAPHSTPQSLQPGSYLWLQIHIQHLFLLHENLRSDGAREVVQAVRRLLCAHQPKTDRDLIPLTSHISEHMARSNSERHHVCPRPQKRRIPLAMRPGKLRCWNSYSPL